MPSVLRLIVALLCCLLASAGWYYIALAMVPELVPFAPLAFALAACGSIFFVTVAAWAANDRTVAATILWIVVALVINLPNALSLYSAQRARLACEAAGPAEEDLAKVVTAADLYSLSWRQMPLYARSAVRAAELYAQAARYATAIEWFDRALAVRPGAARVRYLRDRAMSDLLKEAAPKKLEREPLTP
ncbi:MAG: hypothetical protein V2A58_15045 [Planctomycetota bacterium]